MSRLVRRGLQIGDGQSLMMTNDRCILQSMSIWVKGSIHIYIIHNTVTKCTEESIEIKSKAELYRSVAVGHRPSRHRPSGIRGLGVYAYYSTFDASSIVHIIILWSTSTVVLFSRMTYVLRRTMNCMIPTTGWSGK